MINNKLEISKNRLNRCWISNTTPDYCFGFNGMLMYDDVRDEKLTSYNEGRGNSYSTEYRFYDNRAGRWLSIDPLASKFPWSSPYVAMGNNPVIFVDPRGDIIESTQEGFDITNEGLTATLGEKHPFSFVPDPSGGERGKWAVDETFDVSDYVTEQMEVYNNFKESIKSDVINNVHIVHSDQMLPSNIQPGGAFSLIQGNRQGITVYWDRRRKIDTYIARYPQAKLFSIQDVASLPLFTRGVVALHEIGGHGFFYMTKPYLTKETNDNLTESFETSFRKIYVTGHYSKFEQVWYGIWSFFGLSDKHPAGSPKILAGEAEKHK